MCSVGQTGISAMLETWQTFLSAPRGGTKEKICPRCPVSPTSPFTLVNTKRTQSNTSSRQRNQELLMNRLRSMLVLVLTASIFLAPLHAVRAQQVIVFDGDTYAAIAYSPSTGKWGYGYNYGTRGGAERAALRTCNA